MATKFYLVDYVPGRRKLRLLSHRGELLSLWLPQVVCEVAIGSWCYVVVAAVSQGRILAYRLVPGDAPTRDECDGLTKGLLR